jgi:hypothetical protein
MKIDVLYWSMKLGKNWKNHPEFQSHMMKLRDQLIVTLQAGGMIQDVQFIDKLPINFHLPRFNWGKK